MFITGSHLLRVKHAGARCCAGLLAVSKDTQAHMPVHSTAANLTSAMTESRECKGGEGHSQKGGMRMIDRVIEWNIFTATLVTILITALLQDCIF